MRVALFGGSFNPPHVGHQLGALYVLETHDVHELWLVPCFLHPFDKSLAAFEDRFRMCELMAAALGSRVRVDDVERQLGGASRTLRTVQALKDAHPAHDFSLVIGSDLSGETSSWYGADELRRLLPFIVVGRAAGGAGAHPADGDAACVLMPAVSSTSVRQRLAAGLPVNDRVSRGVLDYIREKKLYGVPPPHEP